VFNINLKGQPYMQLIRYHNPEIAHWPPRLSSLHEEIDRLFDGSLASFGGWSPALDVFQDKENVYVQAELPGMKKEQIDIRFQDGVLTLCGERKEETSSREGEVFHTERFFGKFHRTVSMPAKVNAETITANYKDGILTVQLPKAVEAKAKQIDVTAS